MEMPKALVAACAAYLLGVASAKPADAKCVEMNPCHTLATNSLAALAGGETSALVNLRALVAMCFAPIADKPAAVLRVGLADNNAFVRRVAARTAMGAAPGLLPEHLADADLFVRFYAIAAQGNKASDAMRGLLSQAVVAYRLGEVKWLSLIFASSSNDELQDIQFGCAWHRPLGWIERDSPRLLISAIVDWYGEHPDQRAVEQLLVVAAMDRRDEWFADGLLRALPAVIDENPTSTAARKAYEPLVEMLISTRYERTAAHAAELVVRYNLREAVPRVLPLLAGDNHAAAAWVLGAFKSCAAVDPLIGLLKRGYVSNGIPGGPDENPEVWALKQLAVCKPQARLKVAADAPRDSDDMTPNYAAEVLAAMTAK